MTTRLVAIPDTDGELESGLGRLEEALLALQPYDDDDEPAPDGLGPEALGALQRVSATVGRGEAGAEVLAADGRFELVPLRFVSLAEADLAAVGAAVATFGQCLLPRGDERGADVIRERLEGNEKPADLVVLWARCHGLLDLAPSDDAWRLADRLGGASGRVVLSADEEASYRRLTDRVLALFHGGDPLARFLYRGAGQ